MSGADARPLAGLRVLELGQILAGPFAGVMLGYFGADVIKVESPGSGDPIRSWRLLDDDGTSLWWRSLGRNKRCVTLDLGHASGQALARRLAARADVLIENFRPGTMEGWGLGPDRLCAENPGLVFARISGFGQTGPYAARPGYASVCEAFGGLRHLTGNPGEVPVRANLSLGDSLAGLHGLVGILLALEARRRSGRGQVVDASIFESVFNVLESVVPEFDRAGAVRGPSGPTVSGIVPSNAYPTADGERVVIGANNSANFEPPDDGRRPGRPRAGSRRSGGIRGGCGDRWRSTRRSPAGRARGRPTPSSSSWSRPRFRSRRSTPSPTCSPIRTTAPADFSRASRPAAGSSSCQR